GARVPADARGAPGAPPRPLLRAAPAAPRRRDDRPGGGAARRAGGGGADRRGPGAGARRGARVARRRASRLARPGAAREPARRAGRCGGRARRVRGEPEGGDGGAEQGLAGGRRGPPAGHARRTRAARGAPPRRALPRLPAGRSRGARGGDRAPARRPRLRGGPRARGAQPLARALFPRAAGGASGPGPRRAPGRARARRARAEARLRAGIAGPRLMDLREPGRELSAGERHVLPFLCLPRAWLRHRARTRAPYPVSGVMGAALLVTRACYLAVGGFAAEIEVYYEDVDFCLAARAHGFEIVIEPRAV